METDEGTERLGVTIPFDKTLIEYIFDIVKNIHFKITKKQECLDLQSKANFSLPVENYFNNGMLTFATKNGMPQELITLTGNVTFYNITHPSKTTDTCGLNTNDKINSFLVYLMEDFSVSKGKNGLIYILGINDIYKTPYSFGHHFGQKALSEQIKQQEILGQSIINVKKCFTPIKWVKNLFNSIINKFNPTNKDNLDVLDDQLKTNDASENNCVEVKDIYNSPYFFGYPFGQKALIEQIKQQKILGQSINVNKWLTKKDKLDDLDGQLEPNIDTKNNCVEVNGACEETGGE